MADVVERLKLIGDPARFQILQFLAAPDPTCCARDDGVCGCDIEDLLGLSQPTVSHHMKLLVEHGLVSSEKRGRWVYYALEPAALREIADVLQRLADRGALVQPELQPA